MLSSRKRARLDEANTKLSEAIAHAPWLEVLDATIGVSYFKDEGCKHLAGMCMHA